MLIRGRNRLRKPTIKKIGGLEQLGQRLWSAELVEERKQCRAARASRGIILPEIRAAPTVLQIFATRQGKGILMLIYHCPTTRRIVRTGIDTSEADVRRLGALKLSLWCPHCQIGHSILCKDTQLAAN